MQIAAGRFLVGRRVAKRTLAVRQAAVKPVEVRLMKVCQGASVHPGFDDSLWSEVDVASPQRLAVARVITVFMRSVHSLDWPAHERGA
jgi:hypothetical protein